MEKKKKRKMGDDEIISFSLLPGLFEHFPGNCCEASGKCPYARNITGEQPGLPKMLCRRSKGCWAWKTTVNHY
jgi:hypothetical protein